MGDDEIGRLIAHMIQRGCALQVLEPRAFYPVIIMDRDALFQSPPPCSALLMLASAASAGSFGVHWWRHAMSERSNNHTVVHPESILGRLGAQVCPAALAAQGSIPIM